MFIACNLHRASGNYILPDFKLTISLHQEQLTATKALLDLLEAHVGPLGSVLLHSLHLEE